MRRDRYLRRLLTSAVVLSLVGCSQSARLGHMASTSPAPEDEACLQAETLDFIDCMAGQPHCTFAQAVRGVAMSIHGTDPAKTFEGQYQFLLERGVVNPGWELGAGQQIDRGTLSYMLYKAMGLKGGVNMLVFGSWGLGDRRFAYRELLYRKLVEGDVDYALVSGPELISTLGKVDDFMSRSGRYAPGEKVQLGEKPKMTR